jgi:hypothetical protein
MPANPSAAHPARRAHRSRPPPPAPTATPTTTPIASSSSACPGPTPPSPSTEAAPAIARTTTGVAIPSLRPLSTVISRRIRDGTALFVTTGIPSAASVGANAAATSRASQRSSPGRSHTARAHPSRIVRGRPKPSSRIQRPRSCRRSDTRMRAASENRTHTRVTSTSGLRLSGADGASIVPSAARATPTATKTIGAVRSARSSRAETIPHTKTAAAITVTAATSMPASCVHRPSWSGRTFVLRSNPPCGTDPRVAQELEHRHIGEHLRADHQQCAPATRAGDSIH